MIVAVIHSTPFHANSAFVWNEAFGSQIAMAGSGSDRPSKEEVGDEKKDNIVITPGGPRPADQVHPVGPGQVVRRNPDGTYSVVPDTTPDSNKRGATEISK